jgi:hypothetical protein
MIDNCRAKRPAYRQRRPGRQQGGEAAHNSRQKEIRSPTIQNPKSQSGRREGKRLAQDQEPRPLASAGRVGGRSPPRAPPVWLGRAQPGRGTTGRQPPPFPPASSLGSTPAFASAGAPAPCRRPLVSRLAPPSREKRPLPDRRDTHLTWKRSTVISEPRRLRGVSRAVPPPGTPNSTTPLFRLPAQSWPSSATQCPRQARNGPVTPLAASPVRPGLT